MDIDIVIEQDRERGGALAVLFRQHNAARIVLGMTMIPRPTTIASMSADDVEAGNYPEGLEEAVLPLELIILKQVVPEKLAAHQAQMNRQPG